ncbi:MAG TPA: hypothetical protein P5081_17195 [Phycisphaerae bacterium]|nr:hypothetical protein [Phycisphaerae bacterium]HRW54610.1 hypothetical protein [Phycisphaerae bacterium]
MRIGLTILLLCAVPCAATTILVDDTAPPSGDGLSWTTAFTDLQDALDAARLDATIDAIHVAAGAYLPDRGTANRAMSFELVDGVALLGGFPDGGGIVEDRDREAHPTILSGDLLADDGPLNQFGGWTGQNNNSLHVVRATNCGGATTFDGFILEHGYVETGSPLSERVGGNMLIQGGAPIVSNCRFERGRSEWGGGGIAVVDAAAVIDGCEFHQNIGADFGGGVAVFGTIAADIRNSRFDANIGGSGMGVFCGPIIFSSGAGNATTIVNCDFVDGIGIIGATSGGGVALVRGNNAIVGCRFINNKANGGGGVGANRCAARIERCVFIGNRGDEDGGGAVHTFNFESGTPIDTVEIVSCLIVGNNGGVVGIGTKINVTNCTIADNQIPGISVFLTWPALLSQDAEFAIRNSIVWGNLDRNFFGGARDFLYGDPLYAVADSVIQDWDGSLAGSAISANPGFTDNNGPDGDPLTIDDNDYSLRLDSPALETGDNAALPASAMFDAFGEDRIKDGDADSVAAVDIGALERCALDNADDGCERLGDLTGDGAVDADDIAQFVADLLSGTGSILSDVNRDDAIDARDIAPFVTRLIEGR